MSGTWDATILSAYAAGTGEPFAVDAVANAKSSTSWPTSGSAGT